MGFGARVPSLSLGCGIYEHVTLIPHAMLGFGFFFQFYFSILMKYAILDVIANGTVAKIYIAATFDGLNMFWQY